jgi:hypothetical protein
MIGLIILLSLLCTGCLASNLKEVVEALGKDQNQNCVVVTTIYGGLSACRAAPGSSITMPGGQRVEAAPTAGGGSVTVPVTVPTMTLTPK